jgi:type I restriction enzyme S subunit
MAKLIYDYWFIQFNFPNNNRPYKMNNGKMTFNNKLNRKIPNEWKVGLLSEKIKIMSGFPFSSKDYVENGKYKIITIKNVQESFLKTNKVDTINSLPRKMSNCIKLNIGDVLISLTGNVGRLCFVDEENLLLNQRVGKLICEDNFLFYGYLFFNRPENQTRLKNIAIGSDQANLSPVEMVKEYFLIPPNDVLNKFIGIIKPIFEQFIKNNQKNKKIAELKNLFLPMLVNGKLRIN